MTAYSTLGHFADPVLSTMLDYDDLDLVGTIFHELAHQLIYVPGDSEFDESFAMSVQDEGVRRWLAARGRSAELDHYLQQQRIELQIVQRLTEGRRALKQLYAEPLPLDQRRARKHELMASLAQQVRAIEVQHGLHTAYDDWIGEGLNNARLASVGTYFDCVAGFESLLARHAGDLPAFYGAVRALSHKPQARRALCRAAARAARPQAEMPVSAGCCGVSHCGASPVRLEVLIPSCPQPSSRQTLSSSSDLKLSLDSGLPGSKPQRRGLQAPECIGQRHDVAGKRARPRRWRARAVRASSPQARRVRRSDDWSPHRAGP